jgi:gliding motility-associated-like protein
VFDPNDTSNDIFHPNVKGADQYRFSVYSRWGELLFESRDPAQGWDGYYKGKLCTQDVYIWKISATFIDGKSINQTGDVLLLR